MTMYDVLQFVTGPLPGTALPAKYNLALVALSYVVASLAAYTAIDLAGRVSEFRAEARRAASWLAGGGVAMGAGIWSMHFVGMLAYQLPIPIRYEPWTTFASMVAAVVTSAFALYIVTRDALSWRRLLIGGAVMGAGIGTMHYTGMAAMRLDALVMYHIAPWLLSVANAIVCSTIAIWLVFRLGATSTRNKTLAALVMGVAISGMHYTGMYATVCVSTGQTAQAAFGLDPVPLAATIATVTLGIMGVALTVSLQSQLMSRTLKQQNQLLMIEIEQRRGAEAELQSHRVNLQEVVNRRTQELTQANLELRGSEARFRTTFDSAPVGIMHTSVDDDRILLANPKLSQMLGYTGEELRGLKTDDFLHPDQAAVEDWPTYREKMLKGEMDNFSSERRYVRKDGSALWVSRTVSLARDPGGRPLYFIRLVEDINERTLMARRRAMEHAVTQVLAESATEEEAMQLVLRTICQALGWACGTHWQWDEAAELLRCAEAWPADNKVVAEFIAAARENPNEAPAWRLGAAPGTSAGGVVRRVWFSGAPVWFPDIMQQPDFRRGPMAAKAGLRSAFGFPILAETRPLGVMEFYGREIEQPDEALLQMVRAIGSQIGQFIQRKRAEEKVLRLAQFDTVTGLPNRHLFNDRLGQMLTQARRNDWSVGVLFVDLDRFKAVNDTYGHAAGDMLLREVAARLKKCLRSGDTVGRLSGDEFAVMLSNLAKADDAGLVAQKIVEALASPFDLDGRQSYISASIGIALFPSDGAEPDTLVKNADIAMYRAKEQGRNGYQFYLPQMNERLMQRLRLETRLRSAMERKEFVLHYQPKVSLETGAMTGFEALLRWRQGDTLVSPAEFIPALEETHLIVPVGEWVLRSACDQLMRWREQGVAARPVAVNLSARQFQHRNLAAVVEQILRETGVAPDLIELELTETLLMSDAEEAVQTLRALKSLGVRLAIDDFGTGYSSLAYLRRFPLDSLKIDRAFIRDVGSNADDAVIVQTIISLAHGLKLKVVAEGVETAAQLDFLSNKGCDEIQGYYFARPQPAEDCTRALIEGRRLQRTQGKLAPDLPTLLLVDDDKHELELLERTFAAAGFRVLTANGPEAGLILLARYGAAVVVSDQRMPEMTGVEFLGRVRTLYCGTVCMIISSAGDVTTLAKAVNNAGIHKLLSKDWDPPRLRAEVREAYRLHSLRPRFPNRQA
jgi:diguanylate cyclase (GGDEF)-like protein/PAS domain S-box-containing protein